LEEAARILERDGRCTIDFEKPDGSCCTVGAINRAASGDADGWPVEAIPALTALIDHLDHLGLLPLGAPLADVAAHTVGEWNDDPQRTDAEVLAVLRRVAGECRERGE